MVTFTMQPSMTYHRHTSWLLDKLGLDPKLSRQTVKAC
jgi:hypothetical protein